MKNIVLIGMAGAGKSTLGVLLAKTLGFGFIDTDLLIQEKEEALLQEIIENKGLEYFMSAEEEVCAALNTKNNVIATGGSVVLSGKAMDNLKKNGTVVYLKVPYDEIKRRLSNITTRGIVFKEGQSLRDVYNERVTLYEKYADKVIEFGKCDLEDAILLLVKKVKY
jgi:Shikimate kinase